MKQFILSVLVASLMTFGVVAQQSASVTIPANGFTNFTINPGQLLVVGMVINSAGSNTLQFVDTPAKTLLWTNSSFVYTGTYVSNVVTTWTNYYGVTNSYTNNALVRYSITNATTTNSWPVRLTTAATASGLQNLTPLNVAFDYGLFITNSGPTNATVTISYVQ